MMNANTSVASSDIGARIKRGIVKALEYAALIFGSFVALLPIVSSFMTSFKSAEEYASSNAMTPPQNWLNFSNYRQVWVEGDMLRAFLTSFGVVIVVVFVSVMMGSMLAYVLNRFAFPGNDLIRNLFMIATLIPGIAMQVTTYQIMRQLGLLNSIWGYMSLMSGTDVISIYIFLQFFENLNVALDESAVLEGCTYFGVFFKILLPLTKPAIVTVADLQSNSWRTISTALYSFSGPFKSSYNIICAGVLLTLIPSLIIFLFFQKQVYAGLANGSVKG